MILYWLCVFGCSCMILTGLLLYIFADSIKHYGLYAISYLIIAVGMLSGIALLKLMGLI